MRNPLLVLVLIFTLCLSLIAPPVAAQEPDPVVNTLTLVNKARVAEGLAPYSLSSLLSSAAQRHADDLAVNGFADPDDVHLGSDGTHEQQRITDAGYEAWSRGNGDLTVDENVWSGQGGAEEAMAFFMEDLIHRANILSTVYREIGIGVASDAAGRSYYVLDFGARPNVLPIFINEGADQTDNLEIAIRLTNEEAQPEGKGANFIGQVIEIRINNEPAFGQQAWQPWAPFVPWTLPNEPGEHTVYVQFRDAAGRTAASTDSIVLGEGVLAVSPSPVISPTTQPITAIVTAEPIATTTPSALETITPQAQPTPTAPGLQSPTPPRTQTSTPSYFPTWTPLPTETPQQPENHGGLLALLAVFQGVALVLGLYLVLRRGGERDVADRMSR